MCTNQEKLPSESKGMFTLSGDSLEAPFGTQHTHGTTLDIFQYYYTPRGSTGSLKVDHDVKGHPLILTIPYHTMPIYTIEAGS